MEDSEKFHAAMNTVLITGIGRGIGEALAKKFLAEGFRVIGTSMSGAVSYEHANLSVCSLDLSSPRSIAECARRVADQNISIDVFINNAGVLLDEDDTRVIVEKLRSTLEVNVIGTIDFTEHVIPLMKHGGHIVSISSTAGSLALADGTASHFPYHYPAYKISKAALNMYTRTLALRLKDSGVIVSSVHPGWVRTDMGGPEADLSPEEAAEGIFKTAIQKPETGQFWFRGKKEPW